VQDARKMLNHWRIKIFSEGVSIYGKE